MTQEVSLAEFKVLMSEFNDAINVVAASSRIVHETLNDIAGDLRHVTDLWQSPAAQTFDPLRTAYQASSQDLDDVLTGILHRMRITYQNYVDVENKAVQNLTVQQQGSQSAAGGDTDSNKQPAPKPTDTRPSTVLARVNRASEETVRVQLPHAGGPQGGA